MESYERRKRIFLFGSSFAILLSFFLVILIISLYLDEENFRKSDVKKERYIFTTYDTKTNISTTGFTKSSSVELKDDEYLPFSKNGNSYFLISKVETTRYRCIGSCFCDEDRRTSSTMVFRGVVMSLVAAISSTIAYKKAGNHFREECTRIITPDNGLQSCTVKSSVDECYILRSDDEEDEDSDHNLQNPLSSVFNKHPTTFYCEGSCLIQRYLLPEKKKLCEEFLEVCEDLTLSAPVKVGLQFSFMGKLLARREFEKGILNKFCEKESIARRPYKNILTGEDEEISCCTGEQITQNESVYCDEDKNFKRLDEHL